MKRFKAVGTYVPSQMKNIAKIILCKQLKPYQDSFIDIHDFTDKYMTSKTSGNKK